MPERYVRQVKENIEYNEGGRNYFLYLVINDSTAHTFNMRNGDIVTCRIHAVFEEQVIENDRRFVPVLLLDQEHKFEFFTFVHTALSVEDFDTEINCIRLTDDFVLNAEIKRDDYLEISLLGLERGSLRLSIFPNSERWGFRPYWYKEKENEI